MAKEKTKMNFEQALSKLEKITDKLEEGKLGLEESLKLFSEGIELSGFCNAKLEEVKKRIQVLVKTSEGKPKTEKFKTIEEE